MQQLRVAVIGAGTGGLAIATLLARRGHGVHVFERAPVAQPVGAGLLLQPSGAAVLHRLGALDAVRGRGARIDALDGHTAQGRRVLGLRYSHLAPRLSATGVHRASLFDALLVSATAAGAAVHTNTLVEGVYSMGASLDRRSRPVQAALVARPCDDRGCGAGVALCRDGRGWDLVVLADGSNSKLRARLFPESHAPLFSYGAVWTVVNDPGGRYMGTGALTQRYRGTQVMAGVLPTGRASDGGVPLATLFWSLAPGAEREWIESRGAGSTAQQQVLQRWRRDAHALWPEAADLWEQPQSADQFAYASYADVHMRRWHRGGDHGFSSGDGFVHAAACSALRPGASALNRADPVLRLLHPARATRERAGALRRATGPGLDCPDVAEAPPVVCLGDVAHGTSPQLGQGANMALVDAMALDDCLAWHTGRVDADASLILPPHGASRLSGQRWLARRDAGDLRRVRAGTARLSLGAALRLYEAERSPSTWYYQLSSRYLTLFFQSDYAPLGLLRDGLMHPAYHLPVVGTEMLRVLAGVKPGLLGACNPADWVASVGCPSADEHVKQLLDTEG